MSNPASIAETLSNLKVDEILALIKELEGRWGVSAAVAAAAAPTPEGAAAAEVKTSFNLVLKNAGANKLQLIKLIRELSPGLGLVEAKAVAEKEGSVLAENLPADKADEWIAKFKEVGATVDKA